MSSRQGRQRTGRHHIIPSVAGAEVLDPLGEDPRRKASRFGHGAQKSGLLSGGFDQMDGGIGPIRQERRHHQSGEPGAGTEVSPSPRLWREFNELGAVEGVA